MNRPKKLIFAVTNDLNYDQRMSRICTSLSKAGYQVTLIGRNMPASVPLAPQLFHQHRISCFFSKGFAFYAEYNIRLFFFLLFQKCDLVGAVDLDTAIPCRLLARLKRILFVYDAHELFCEMKEVVNRPNIYRTWKGIEKWVMHNTEYAYTVNHHIADELENLYGRSVAVIRNLPLKNYGPASVAPSEDRYILYQGAVNEGRCFESLIPAMKHVPCRLVVCGNGNFMDQAQLLTRQHGLEHKISFTGWLRPQDLLSYTRQAFIGVNIIENNGRNNYLSLSNRFFHYIQSALPQVCVSYPAYREIVDQYECAHLVDDTDAGSIAYALNLLLMDNERYNRIRDNCIRAREVLNWENEEQKLLSFYHHIFQSER